MKLTINEVAKLAGVSKATVSRVINESKPVNQDKKEKVLRAIEELQFKPNPVARGLVQKRTGFIGVLIPDITNSFFAEIVRGIECVVQEHQYHIVLCHTFHSHEKEVEHLRMLREKYVDGIVFMTSKVTEAHKRFFSENKLPVTFVNRKCNDLRSFSVDINNYQAAKEITSFFLKRGHRQIAIIRAPLTDRTSGYERFKGYQDALKMYHIPLREHLVLRSTFKIDSAYKAVKRFLNEGYRATAIVATSDLMAIGAIKALIDHGLRIPENVEVSGFDDVPIAMYYNPSITTIRQPIIEIGKTAGEMLIAKIEGINVTEKNIVLPHSIIFRKSTLKSPVLEE
ncbi:LacI family DNA-binding transcriptional regulator [Tindallia californiensis]|uniref:Transcriptional regulator, LacI family n=1 Tax=Tindallia californiensis TaxID=159292 RepID=A0A1H3I695_9FIRM|nr:substrate-binding domain-containing protein [Tindallia californiensis]SDY23207.1 transcriptional regulator, LacI family [Tindallia californiensis]